MADSNPGNNTNLALKIVGFSVLAGVLILVVYELKVLIMCLIFALTLASAIAPVAEWAEKKKIPRMITVIVIYIITALVYAFLAVSLLPTIAEQGLKLYENLPGYTNKLVTWYHSALNLAGDNANAITVNVDDMRGLATKLLQKTLNMTAGFAGLIANTILTLFLTAYFVVEAKKIIPTMLTWIPPKARTKLSPLLVPLESRLGGYVRGQLLVALAVSIILVTGFSLIGLKYALVLGLVAGLLNLVPYVGSMVATIGAIIVGFNQAPVMALYVLAIYGVEQWIESSFLVPHLLGQHVSLHPLIVLLAILCGATLFGIAGALVAIPVTSGALLLAEEFYFKPLQNTGAAEEEAVNEEAAIDPIDAKNS